MKNEPLSSGKPVTRYYLCSGTLSGTSLVVVSSFKSLIDDKKRTLEFLVFSWDDPANISFPYADRSESTREEIDDLFDVRFAGPVREYILNKQSMNDYSRTLNEEQLSFEQVERNIINVIAFPHGVRLLEIIIIATDCYALKEELRTLRDFILLVNSTDGHSG